MKLTPPAGAIVPISYGKPQPRDAAPLHSAGLGIPRPALRPSCSARSPTNAETKTLHRGTGQISNHSPHRLAPVLRRMQEPKPSMGVPSDQANTSYRPKARKKEQGAYTTQAAEHAQLGPAVKLYAHHVPQRGLSYEDQLLRQELWKK